MCHNRGTILRYGTCSVECVKSIVVALLILISACTPETVPTTLRGDTSSTTLSYAAEGGVLYDAHCALCHGPEGTGTTAGSPLIDEMYSADQTDDVAFLVSVTDGVEPGRTDFQGMAAITHLSHSDIARITAYIRELQE